MSGFYDWDSDYVSGDFKHWEPVGVSPELAALVASGFLWRGAKVLDVGCGGGLNAVFMAQHRFDVLGVDLSVESLKIAKKRAADAYINAKFVAADVFDLPFNAETFEFMTDRGLFHLIEDRDRSRYASEALRVLKPLGSVVIRGASEIVERERFNPVSDKAVDEFFPRKKWIRSDVVSMPLFSSVGAIDAGIVILKKRAGPFRQVIP